MENFQHVPGYPECKNAKPIIETISEPCPKCGGVVQVKKSKKGRKFYVCENNAKGECDYISWTKPSKEGENQEQDQVKKKAKAKTKKEKKSS